MLSKYLQAGAAASAAVGAIVLGKGLQHGVCSEQVSSESTDGLQSAIKAARELTERRREECGAPGISVAVSKNGRPLWQEGLGYADVENLAPMTPRHVMRIASISKPMTMAAAARAVDAGELNVHAPIQHYLPDYPATSFEGQQVDITLDQLATHRGGIRHYLHKHELKPADKPQTKKEKDAANTELAEKKADESNKQDEDAANKKVLEQKADENVNRRCETDNENKTKKGNDNEAAKETKGTRKEISEFKLKDYNITTNYKSVGEALTVFKDDELVVKPGLFSRKCS